MQRIVTWHIPYPGAALPAFYMERGYSPEKLRIYAANAPQGADLEIDIRDDGTTIFGTRGQRPTSAYVTRLIGTTKTTAVLPKGANLEEHADDFLESVSTIEEGSILTCHEIESGGASNVTVQLELESLDEEGEESD